MSREVGNRRGETAPLADEGNWRLLRAYAQLVRLPALPTALADIALGAVVTGALPQQWLPFGLLLAATACLYAAGMAWNDFFDLDKDRRERPERPLPSGKITRTAAGRLGTALLTAGLLFAVGADVARGPAHVDAKWLSTEVALGLTAVILLYDGWLKNTVLGPIAMGACRFLNVLLGLSVIGSIDWPMGPHLAFVVGLYITGVTWLARTEGQLSSPNALAGAAGTILTALLLALPVPLHRDPPNSSWFFIYLLVLLGFAVGLPVRRALARPQPGPVQAAVKRCLLCLIVLDAVLATGLAGPMGLVLLVLLAPALYWNRRRWLYAT